MLISRCCKWIVEMICANDNASYYECFMCKKPCELIESNKLKQRSRCHGLHRETALRGSNAFYLEK